MPVRQSYEKQWEGDELREDMKKIVSEYLTGPGSIGHSETVTFSWQVQGNLQLKFGDATASLGGSYSESKTVTNTYTENIPDGKTMRMVYIPMMHHINGWWTDIEGGDIIPNPLGPSIPTEVVVIADHQWCSLYFPIEGGQFVLESRDDGTVIKLGS